MTSHNTSFEEEKVPSEDTPIFAEEKSQKQSPREDFKAYAFILILYMAQGLPNGFFASAIGLILTSNGASMGQLGSFQWVSVPYFFKIFYAPMLDSYYARSIGARKSYIIPSLAALTMCYIFGSVYITDMVTHLQIGSILIMGIVTITAATVLDVASDGWLITLVDKKYLPEATTLSSIGVHLGIFLSFNLLIPFNSVSFCNDHIYSTPQTTPIVTLPGFMVFMAVFSLITLVVVFMYKEKRIHIEKPNIKDIYKLYPKMVTNPHLRKLFIYLLIYAIPIVIATAPAGALLIQKGFKKETQTNISTLHSPFYFTATYLAIKIQHRFKKLWLFKISYCMALAMVIIPIIYWQAFDEDKNYNSIAISMFIVGILDIHVGFIRFQSLETFTYGITHNSVASTFVTCVHGIKNFGAMWATSFGLYLADFINIWVLYFIGLAFGIFVVYYMHTNLDRLEKKAPEDFEFYLQQKESAPRDSKSSMELNYEPLNKEEILEIDRMSAGAGPKAV